MSIYNLNLPCGRIAEIDEEDFEVKFRVQLANGISVVTRVCDVQWRSNAQKIKCYCHGRVMITGNNVSLLLHRLLMSAQKCQVIDHKDGDGLNNVRSNLRLATHAENMRNQKLHVDSTSGFKGVRVRKTGFYSYIKHAGAEFHLGVFRTAEDAARAYDDAAIERFGEFANTNFPRSLVTN